MPGTGEGNKMMTQCSCGSLFCAPAPFQAAATCEPEQTPWPGEGEQGGRNYDQCENCEAFHEKELRRSLDNSVRASSSGADTGELGGRERCGHCPRTLCDIRKG